MIPFLRLESRRMIHFGNCTDFVKAADQALYTAKMRGRNRTVPFDRQLSGAVARSG